MMNWVIFAGACFSLAVTLLGISAWWLWYLKRGSSPFFCFLSSVLLCAVAWGLAPSFLGFNIAGFERYDVFLPYIYIAYLHFSGMFIPATIVLLILSVIPTSLGVFFLVKMNRDLR